MFVWFGEVECPQLDAHLYRQLCRGIARCPELLELAACAPPTQPPPNLLFAAVHDLLLGGEQDELRAWYPELAGGAARAPASAFAPFRRFCLAHRDRIVARIATRRTQTNVVQRCSALLPAFSRIHASGGGRPLALIEIGASAGLNLHWDRFHYRYEEEAPGGTAARLEWGDPRSPVRIDCALRGDVLPSLPRPEIPVAWRHGVDLDPIDVTDPDAVRWLRALVWPDHPGRQERLTAAIGIALAHPVELVAGDASLALPDLIAAAPRDATLCVYGTHTLYQFPRPALVRTLRALQAGSAAREIHFASMEGTGDRCSELHLTRYRDGERETVLATRCNPHGRWIEWLG